MRVRARNGQQALDFVAMLDAIAKVPAADQLHRSGDDEAEGGDRRERREACILGLGAFYTAMSKFGLSAFTAITVFGLVVAGTMELIRRWHLRNCVEHRDEVERLLAIARSDPH